MGSRLANYIRPRRKQAGLSQRELSTILGYDNEGAVSRQERFRSIPPLLIALGYEVIFQAPVSELFPGLCEGVEGAINQRLEDFAERLRKKKPTPAQAAIVARKLEWIKKRRVTHGH